MKSWKKSLARLRAGNKRFCNQVPPAEAGDLSLHQAQQKPFAAILCCADSRVAPEIIFHQGLGQLFVVRVAGNVVGPLQAGSLELAVDAFDVPLIVILGHTNCSAVKAAMRYSGDHHSATDEILSLIHANLARNGVTDDEDAALVANTSHAADTLLAHSSVIREAYATGRVGLATATYNLADGTVNFELRNHS
ncbi:MAG: carbonic anhydrase [Pseudomonadota bacterium]|nr:carbonic anhydrase [Pseudomonadota bacterium]